MSFFSPIISAHPCLTNNERSSLMTVLERFRSYYPDVPNMIECGEDKTHLEAFVCRHQDFLNIFELLSKGTIYGVENAINREVNHLTYNKEHPPYWMSDYNVKNIDYIYLCSQIKYRANDLLGGSSPFDEDNLAQ